MSIEILITDDSIVEGNFISGLLKKLGVSGEWEGIGHCAIGYIDGEIPEPALRREGRVSYI